MSVHALGAATRTRAIAAGSLEILLKMGAALKRGTWCLNLPCSNQCGSKYSLALFRFVAFHVRHDLEYSEWLGRAGTLLMDKFVKK